jgi:hypothetical protein
MSEEEQNGEFSNHAECASDSTNTNASEDATSERVESSQNDDSKSDDFGLKNDVEAGKSLLTIGGRVCKAFGDIYGVVRDLILDLPKLLWGLILNLFKSVWKKSIQACKFLLAILRRLGPLYVVIKWLGELVWKVIRFVANLLWWLWIALLKLEVLILSFGTHKVVKRKSEAAVSETPKALPLSDEDNSAPVDVPSDASTEQTNEQKEK